MVDDAVRERHGCACREGAAHLSSSVTIWEGETMIYINGNSEARILTVWQARYLASKLYRLSRRIKNRQQEIEE